MSGELTRYIALIVSCLTILGGMRCAPVPSLLVGEGIVVGN